MVETTTPPGRRRPRVLLAVAAAAVVLLVAGIVVGLRSSQHGVQPTGDNAGLVDNVWLVSPNGKPSTASFYISRTGVLVADDECRLIGAKAVVSSTRITVTDLSVRLKPCTDQYGAGFYDKGTRVLRGTSTFRIDEAGLTITHAGVGSLHLALAQTPIPPPTLDIPTLTGADWLTPQRKVLHIDPTTGRLSGGWCTGRGLVTGSSVQFTGCPATGTGRYRAAISGTTLTLTASSGHTLVFFWRPTGASVVDQSAVGDRTWRLETVAGQRHRRGRCDSATARP